METICYWSTQERIVSGCSNRKPNITESNQRFHLKETLRRPEEAHKQCAKVCGTKSHDERTDTLSVNDGVSERVPESVSRFVPANIKLGLCRKVPPIIVMNPSDGCTPYTLQLSEPPRYWRY